MSQVLGRRPAGAARQRQGDHLIANNIARLRGSSSTPSSGRLRQRATIEEFGGSLADILQAAVAVPRQRPPPAAGSESPEEARFQPVDRVRQQEVEPGEFGDRLGAAAEASLTIHQPPPLPDRENHGEARFRPLSHARPREAGAVPGWDGTLSTVLPPRFAGQTEERLPLDRAAPQQVEASGSLGTLLPPRLAAQSEERPSPQWGWDEMPAQTGEVRRAASLSVNDARDHAVEPQFRRARSVVVRQGDVQSDCCAICLDAFEPRQRLAELPCRHRFHAPCLREYFSVVAAPRCPYCRTDCSNIIV